MNNDTYNPQGLLDDLMAQSAKIEPASDELRLKLNEIIAANRLDAPAALAVLARLSAGYIHQMQKTFCDAPNKNMIEDMFNNNLQLFLGLFDLTDVNQEIENIQREKRERMN